MQAGDSYRNVIQASPHPPFHLYPLPQPDRGRSIPRIPARPSVSTLDTKDPENSGEILPEG